MAPVLLNDPISSYAIRSNTAGNAGKVNSNRAQKVDNATKTDEAHKLLSRENTIEHKEDVFENLVSVSEDGDTVQVSEEGKELLEEEQFGQVELKNLEEEEKVDSESKEVIMERESRTKAIMEENLKEKRVAEERNSESAMKEVIQKQQETKERIKEQIKEVDEADEADEKEAAEERRASMEKESLVDIPVSTFARTESELQQLFLKGEISRDEMDRAIEAKEEIKDSRRDAEEKFSRESTVVIKMSQKQKNDETEIRQIYSPDASETIDAATRAGIMESLEDMSIAMFS
jgi:hypothetical protein